MAFIQDEEDPLGQGQPGQPGQGQEQAPLVGQGSTQVGQGSGAGGAASPAGAGGQGGWVNLQTYLGANQGDTGSAGALQNKVGGQFGQERDNFTKDSQSFLGDAQKYSDDHSLNQGKVDDITKRATEMYSWGPQGPASGGGDKPDDPFSNDTGTGAQQKVTGDGNPPPVGGNAGNIDSAATYDDLVGQIKHGLTDQYDGQRSYNYGLSNQAQEYGSQLNDNGGFDQLMGQVYSSAAGRPMTSGQNALQKQLDVNNTGLVDARKGLSDQYAQLGKDRDKVVGDTTAALGGIEKNYYNNQNAMRDYLGQKANQYDTQISQAEADARAAYNQSYGGDVADVQSIQDYLTGAFNNYAGGDIPGRDRARDNMGNYLSLTDNGQAGFNWQDAQNELNRSSAIDQNNFQDLYTGSNTGDAANEWSNITKGYEGDYRNQLQHQLDDYYASQTDKYKDLGSEQKGAYNVLQDFLGQENNKKQQGFNVRA